MNKTMKIILAVALIVIVPTGIYLGLAYPSVVLSSPVNASGFMIAGQTYEVVIGFPKAQMQVVAEVTSFAGLTGGIIISDSLGNTIESIAFSGTGTFATTWFNAAGAYNVTVYASLFITSSIIGQVTVYARGSPFIS